MNIIECNNLTHYYGDRCIYENMNFSVKKGSIVGLLGKNGTGKTTTINILNGYLKPRKGYCKIFGEDSSNLSPETKSKIGLLIEGHVQYGFMNIEQIERYYSAFFPNWRKEAYYELMKKLQIAPKQKIYRMSCGQRSQVALGLILAQNPELLILDDFSMGLDPGYRLLFVEYLRDYAVSENKTVFVTSHIIQDMESLIDECIILDYGKILVQKPVKELLDTYKCFSVNTPVDLKELFPNENIERLKSEQDVFTFMSKDDVYQRLSGAGIKQKEIKEKELSLEKAFIGLTGKY